MACLPRKKESFEGLVTGGPILESGTTRDNKQTSQRRSSFNWDLCLKEAGWLTWILLDGKLLQAAKGSILGRTDHWWFDGPGRRKTCLMVGSPMNCWHPNVKSKDRDVKADITLPTKVCLVKAMDFTVVMYMDVSWTIKKAERRRTDVFEL